MELPRVERLQLLEVGVGPLGAIQRRIVPGLGVGVFAHGVLRVVAQEVEALRLESVVVVVAVAHGVEVVRLARGGGRVVVNHVVEVDDIVHQVGRVEVDRVLGIARAVRVLSHRLAVVVRVRAGEALVHRHVPERLPGVDRALGGAGHVAGLRGLDDVVEVGVAAVVRLGVVLVAALLRLVEAPVVSVDEQVVVAAPRVELAHVALRVAREHLMDEGVLLVGAVGSVRPGVVLRSAQVDLLELARALVAEERELERPVAVVIAEEETERVLRVLRVAAERAADADAARRGESVGVVRRVDLLHHRGALPFASVARLGVHVDALDRVEEVVRVDDERDCGNGVREAAQEPVAVRAVHDALIHAVAHNLAVDRGRGEARRHDAARLLEDVVEEEVRRRGVLLDHAPLLRNRRADARGGRDVDRTRVGRGGRGGRRAVKRVVDRRRGVVRAGERQVERRRLVAVRHAERHLRGRGAVAGRGVLRARRGLAEEHELLCGLRDRDFCREQEVRIARCVVDGGDLEEVVAHSEKFRRNGDHDGRQRVRKRARLFDQGVRHDRAVDLRREAVGEAHLQPEGVVRRRRRVERERRLPVKRVCDVEHRGGDVRRDVSRPRAGVGDAARGRADETESVEREVLVVLELALLHAEVERRAARRLEVEEPHVVRARLLDAEDGRGLSVATRARVLGLEVVLLVPRLEREAVVRADAERPAAGARDVDDALDENRVVGAVVGHADLGNGPVARAELGRNSAGRILVGNRLHAGERRLRAVPSARERALDGGDVRAGVLVQLVGSHREAARGRTRHADRAGRRPPFAVADAPLRGIELAEDRLLAVAASVRDVLHLRRQGQRRDDRIETVGAGEYDRAVALADAELGVGLARGPVGVALVAPHELVAMPGHDARTLDLHPLRRLRGVVVHVPARHVYVVVVVVAQLDPVELRAAVHRRGRLAVRGHYLVDEEEAGRRDDRRPARHGQRHRAVAHLEHHRAEVEVLARVRRERDGHVCAFGNEVRAICFGRHLHAVHLDRDDAHSVDVRNRERVFRTDCNRLRREVEEVTVAHHAGGRHVV